eukprot:TRINITY_DN152_c0_g1_i1.p1 TRINITY_DN152_c0_g1~~TRINITY_DN152_c0_g1_i1.p1  ORF type:complete len:1025 (-),score=355.19 TRINITY_DN152_c0_g1_i1:91-3165(-)
MSLSGLKPGNKVGKWTINRKLGNGAFSDVFEVTTSSDKVYAMKVAPLYEVQKGKRKTKKRTETLSAQLLNWERMIYTKFLTNHPNIPSFPSKNFFGEYNETRYLVMQKFRCTLEDEVKAQGGTLSIGHALLIGAQIIGILEKMHSKNLVFRDVKPENYMLGNIDDETVYCVDFGCAERFLDFLQEMKPADPSVGTAMYSSLYVQQGESYSPRDDLISVGYMMCELCVGSLPWNGAKSEKELINVKSRNKTLEAFISDLDREFEVFHAYLLYCYDLSQREKPNYDELMGILISEANSMGISKLEWATRKRSNEINVHEHQSDRRPSESPTPKRRRISEGKKKRRKKIVLPSKKSKKFDDVTPSSSSFEDNDDGDNDNDNETVESIEVEPRTTTRTSNKSKKNKSKPLSLKISSKSKRAKMKRTVQERKAEEMKAKEIIEEESSSTITTTTSNDNPINVEEEMIVDDGSIEEYVSPEKPKRMTRAARKSYEEARKAKKSKKSLNISMDIVEEKGTNESVEQLQSHDELKPKTNQRKKRFTRSSLIPLVTPKKPAERSQFHFESDSLANNDGNIYDDNNDNNINSISIEEGDWGIMADNPSRRSVIPHNLKIPKSLKPPRTPGFAKAKRMSKRTTNTGDLSSCNPCPLVDDCVIVEEDEGDLHVSTPQSINPTPIVNQSFRTKETSDGVRIPQISLLERIPNLPDGTTRSGRTYSPQKRRHPSNNGIIRTPIPAPNPGRHFVQPEPMDTDTFMELMKPNNEDANNNSNNDNNNYDEMISNSHTMEMEVENGEFFIVEESKEDDDEEEMSVINETNSLGFSNEDDEVDALAAFEEHSNEEDYDDDDDDDDEDYGDAMDTDDYQQKYHSTTTEFSALMKQADDEYIEENQYGAYQIKPLPATDISTNELDLTPEAIEAALNNSHLDDSQLTESLVGDLKVEDIDPSLHSMTTEEYAELIKREGVDLTNSIEYMSSPKNVEARRLSMTHTSKPLAPLIDSPGPRQEQKRDSGMIETVKRGFGAFKNFLWD